MGETPKTTLFAASLRFFILKELRGRRGDIKSVGIGIIFFNAEGREVKRRGARSFIFYVFGN